MKGLRGSIEGNRLVQVIGSFSGSKSRAVVFSGSKSRAAVF